MVRTIVKYSGLHYEDVVYDYLQRTYGGHPYLVRLACSELWKASDRTNPERAVEVKISSFYSRRVAIRERLIQPIKDILLSLVWWYPDEYDLLRMLASGEKDFVSQYLNQESGSTIQFARYGLLRPESRDFAIADVQDFFKATRRSV